MTDECCLGAWGKLSSTPGRKEAKELNRMKKKIYYEKKPEEKGKEFLCQKGKRGQTVKFYGVSEIS